MYTWQDNWEFYKDKKDGLWRWMRKRVADGLTLSSSSLGFKTEEECYENAKSRGYSGNE